MQKTIFLFLIILIIKISKNQEINYEIYVLSIQFINNICHISSNIEKCYSNIKYTKNNTFTIHGLWPGKKTGQNLEECSKSDNDIEISDLKLLEKMNKIWPSTNLKNENIKFWSHEYYKHGFCYINKYNLNIEDYFKKTIQIFEKFDFANFIIKSFEGINNNFVYISLREFEKIIFSFYPFIYFKINCKKIKGNIYLSEIHFFFDLDFKFTKVNYSKDTNCPNNDYDLLIIKLI
jgi:ribonuclease I